MTDTAITPRTPAAARTAELDGEVAADCIKRLSPFKWQTAREVHEQIGQWAIVSVRTTLHGLATAGRIETRLAGTPDRPVREYRAGR